MKLKFDKLVTSNETISVTLDGVTWKDYNVDNLLTDGVHFTKEECPDLTKIKVQGKFKSLDDISAIKIVDDTGLECTYKKLEETDVIYNYAIYAFEFSEENDPDNSLAGALDGTDEELVEAVKNSFNEMSGDWIKYKIVDNIPIFYVWSWENEQFEPVDKLKETDEFISNLSFELIHEHNDKYDIDIDKIIVSYPEWEEPDEYYTINYMTELVKEIIPVSTSEYITSIVSGDEALENSTVVNTTLIANENKAIKSLDISKLNLSIMPWKTIDSLTVTVDSWDELTAGIWSNNSYCWRSRTLDDNLNWPLEANEYRAQEEQIKYIGNLSLLKDALSKNFMDCQTNESGWNNMSDLQKYFLTSGFLNNESRIYTNIKVSIEEEFSPSTDDFLILIIKANRGCLGIRTFVFTYSIDEYDMSHVDLTKYIPETNGESSVLQAYISKAMNIETPIYIDTSIKYYEDRKNYVYNHTGNIVGTYTKGDTEDTIIVNIRNPYTGFSSNYYDYYIDRYAETYTRDSGQDITDIGYDRSYNSSRSFLDIVNGRF